MNKAVRRGLHLLIISAITAIFGVLAVVGVSAEVGDTFTVNTIDGAPITYKVTSEGAFPEVEVSDCPDDYKGNVDIPESVENPNDNLEYSVTSIGECAFASCKSLTSVTIPDSVTSIGNRAFEYCESLTSVTIPDSVTSIGNRAFDYCESLTSVTIPDSVTNIGDFAFADCTSLTSVTIPDSVTSIGNGAFYSCESLTSVTIGNSVTSIVQYMFSNCTSLTSVTIGNSVESIEYRAFAWCDSLTSVTIPDSVTSIGYEAFYWCQNLSVVKCVDKKPPSLGSGVFYNCSSALIICIPIDSMDAYVAAGWPENNLFEIVRSVKVVDENGVSIEGAKVMIYLKEYTPFALTGGYTNSEGIYIVYPADIPFDTVEVKKSGYKQVETRVSDSFELVVVMEKI